MYYAFQKIFLNFKENVTSLLRFLFFKISCFIIIFIPQRFTTLDHIRVKNSLHHDFDHCSIQESTSLKLQVMLEAIMIRISIPFDIPGFDQSSLLKFSSPREGWRNLNLYFITLMTTSSLYCLIVESHRFCDRVQDSYTLRCCPQVSRKLITNYFLSHSGWKGLLK